MVSKRNALFMLLAVVFCGIVAAQTPKELLEKGLEYYRDGKWQDAVLTLRRVQTTADDMALKNEALYWISLSELFAGSYDAALQDVEAYLKNAQKDSKYYEAMYNKARILFYLNQFDGAIPIFKTYADVVQDANRKASAYYWIGECLFALGRLDDARNTFSIITEKYPQSSKFEAASYRIALVDQKKIESELLNLLKWSHEESLRTVEEYQRRERSYEQAILAYQKRIAEMLKDTHLADLEKENKALKQKLAEAEAALATASLQPVQSTAAAVPPTETVTSQPQTKAIEQPATETPSTGKLSQEQINKLLALKAQALELQKLLLNRLAASANQGEKK
ncbi:MAG: tetratricopeptide repeat protein [Treponema sp.]|nr:tetratricopeptide repeat protein [Treponema sp.]